MILRQKGVSAHNGHMYTNDIKNGAGNKISDKGDTQVEIVSLNSDIDEKITLVKMDIEGQKKTLLLE